MSYLTYFAVIVVYILATVLTEFVLGLIPGIESETTAWLLTLLFMVAFIRVFDILMSRRQVYRPTPQKVINNQRGPTGFLPAYYRKQQSDRSDGGE